VASVFDEPEVRVAAPVRRADRLESVFGLEVFDGAFDPSRIEEDVPEAAMPALPDASAGLSPVDQSARDGPARLDRGQIGGAAGSMVALRAGSAGPNCAGPLATADETCREAASLASSLVA
jgi:hypothetical protein